MQTRLLFTHALSPLHAGTGQSVGAIDLAIARDRATDLPYCPGSSIKGSIRSRAARGSQNGGLDRDRAYALFGPDTRNASDHAGAIAFGDANLLLLPVRSVAGTFAWVTSPFLLARFARDAREAGIDDLPALPAAGELNDGAVTSNTALEVGSQVVFEDLDLSPRKSEVVDSWAKVLGEMLFPDDTFWQAHLAGRLCIVHDDVMSFLARHGTAIVARIAIDDETGTVDNLWHEESLPAETVLVSLLAAGGSRRDGIKMGPVDVMKALTDLIDGKTVQFGGKASVGRGRCRLTVAGGA